MLSRKPGHAIGAVVRATGLTVHTIRAWEKRFGIVDPIRSPGGTRRYSERDVEKLRLLARAVGEGHRISGLATLDLPALRSLVTDADTAKGESHDSFGAGGMTPVVESLYEATANLDGATLERLLNLQMQCLGGPRFARQVASPLLREIGHRWMKGELPIAAEHLASAHLRRLLGNALAASPSRQSAAKVLVFTPEGERHEFGALIAAIVASSAGASIVYLGAEMPYEAVAEAVRRIPTAALAMSVVSLSEGAQRRYLTALRAALPEPTPMWIGGACAIDDGPAQRLLSLDHLEEKVRALGGPSTLF